jgi:LmbE family N-acetylglucosaminyl deacetylase
MKHWASRLFIAVVACAFLTQCQSPPASSGRSTPVLLAIFAHPDDEASVSAVLAKYAAAGARVHLAIATDGRLGVNEHAGIPAGDALAAARVRESQCATEKLGIEAPVLFGLHDQMKMGEGLPRYFEQMAELRTRVTQLFEELKPDVVITWGPSGWTGHPDHRVVSAVVTEVFQSRDWEHPRQLFYPAVPTGKVPPNNPFRLATVDPRFLPVQVAVSAQDYEKAKSSWLCHMSQYTVEQIEQMHRSRMESLAGTAYFQPVVPATRKSDSLFR